MKKTKSRVKINRFFIMLFFFAFFCAIIKLAYVALSPNVDGKNLTEFANLKKECAVIGVNDRLEIWNLHKFECLMQENEKSLEDICENLFDMTLE